MLLGRKEEIRHSFDKAGQRVGFRSPMSVCRGILPHMGAKPTHITAGSTAPTVTLVRLPAECRYCTPHISACQKGISWRQNLWKRDLGVVGG